MIGKRRPKPSAYMFRRGSHLEPASQYDLDQLLSIPEGKIVSVDWVRKRSDKQERFVNALISLVADGLGEPRDLLYDKIRWDLGMVEEFTTFDGEVVIRMQSTSREAMPDAAAYNQFVTRVVDLVITKLLPDMKKVQLIRRIETMLRIRPELEDDDGADA